MAWTMSVRSWRERVSSAVGRLITKGIDTSAPNGSGSRIALPTFCLCLQLGLLVAAVAHIAVAPVLSFIALAAALSSLSSWSGFSVRKLAAEARKTENNDTPAGRSADAKDPQSSTVAPALTASPVAQAATAQGFPNTISKPISQIAPANDAHAWAGLCARLSHELRTPLNAVLGFSELMKAELHGPLGRPRYREYVTHIRESGRALLKSTEDTLALTEILSGSHSGSPAAMRALAMKPLLEDVWHFLEPAAQARSISLDLDVPSELEVLGDHRALRQALINLLEEAICHAADGGIVRISAAPARSFVDLNIHAGSRNAERLADTLSIHLARALLEISGAQLTVSTGHGEWQARTLLDRATQADFFDNPERKAAAG